MTTTTAFSTRRASPEAKDGNDDERSKLVSCSNDGRHDSISRPPQAAAGDRQHLRCRQHRAPLSASAAAALLLLLLGVILAMLGSNRSSDDPHHLLVARPHSNSHQSTPSLGLLRVPQEGKSKNKHDDDDDDDDDDYQHQEVTAANNSSSSSSLVTRRCKWVVDVFTDNNIHKSEQELQEQYAVQAKDPNVFYRATANIFWMDFVHHGWGDLLDFENIFGKGAPNLYHSDGKTPLQRKSTWTWITGDQHLSNFGAWRNRHGDVVFSVNDFDEAAIYDFQVDVLRIAVSVCSHAYTNGLGTSTATTTSDDDEQNDFIDLILAAFTDTYVETLRKYVGGDKELLFELTPQTASGWLQDFLTNLKYQDSPEKQLSKFTEMQTNKKSGKKKKHRHFIRNDETKLESVSEEVEKQIRDQFTIDKYGATMMKMGWHVRNWDDDYFEVLDIAARIGTGVGSYGVDRYYILLKGTDDDEEEEDDGADVIDDGNAVILDVKYEPPGAVSRILTPPDVAWYRTMFANDAQRAVEGQRRLTSYVDPFTGWVYIDGKAFVVRQRSPWKSSPPISELTDPDDFIDFMEQVAIATATSHARGTAAKSPGQFKHVISSVLSKWLDRRTWSKAVAKVAHEYRQQVLLDFECFKDFVQEKYS